jgi:hypothetical protein
MCHPVGLCRVCDLISGFIPPECEWLQMGVYGVSAPSIAAMPFPRPPLCVCITAALNSQHER